MSNIKQENNKEDIKANFFQTKNEAKQIKNFSKTNVDPILQRDDNKFSKKIKPKTETQNYFSRIQDQPTKTNHVKCIPQKESSIFKELPLQGPERNHKKSLAVEYEKKIHIAKPNSIKTIHCRANRDSIGNIFKGEENTHQPERPHLRYVNNAGKPSAEYQRMNNLRMNVQSEGVSMFSPIRREKEGNTFNNIFSNGGNEQKGEVVYKKNVSHQKSSIGRLLAYDNTPKGYDNVVGKPTQSKYGDLVNSIAENRIVTKKH